MVVHEARSHDGADGEPVGQARPDGRRQEHGDRHREHLDARLEGVEAEHQLQVERDGEEDAHQDEVLGEQPDQTRSQRWDLQEVEVHERIVAGRLAVALPAQEGPDEDPATGDDEEGQREAERLDRRVLGLDHSPGGRLQDAQARSRRARWRPGPSPRSRAGAWRRCGSRRRPEAVMARMNSTRATSPTNTIRHDSSVVAHPPRMGPMAMPAPATPPMHGVGDLAVLALEVSGDQRRHRREHQRGADALEDRPPERELRDRLRRCGQARSARVDDQPDDERPAAADDVADLAAREHQHGHHKAVERDHGLDRGDRRVEVGDQLADRHVHDRLVEHHDELCGRQRHQRQPSLHPGAVPSVAFIGVVHKLGGNPVARRRLTDRVDIPVV